MPRFVLSFDSERPDPAFAQIVVQTADSHARDALRVKLRALVDEGRFPEARVQVMIFAQPFGFNAILGLIVLSGILMRNTLILVDQIYHGRAAGLSDYDAIVESTVRRAHPVILTAAATMLAFIPLTHPVFWGALAYVLIGGVGTLLTLLFLPALYAL